MPKSTAILNLELFIVRKIAFSSRKTFSAFIIRIAIAAVALSLCTMIITTAMVTGFQTQIRNKILGFWSHVQIIPFSLTSSLDEKGVYRYQDFYTQKGLLPGVAHIQVTALKGGLLKTDDDFEGIVLKGVGDDFKWANFKPYLKEGRLLQLNKQEGRKDIIISKATSTRLELDTGDNVTVSFMGNRIRNRPFVVSGIYETGLEEFDRKYAMIDIGVIQELNGWGTDTIGGFEVFLEGDQLFKPRSRAYMLTLFGGLMNDEKRMQLQRDPLEEMAETIYSNIANPGLDVQTIKSIVPGIFDWLELQTMNELIILTLMLVVAAINMITALLILILERTNMIGIMKALGAGNLSIRRVFLFYSIVIIGAGLLLGNIAGIGFCLLQQYTHLIKLPAESYYLSYAPVELNYSWILLLNIGTIALTLALLVLPTLLVSRISPVKAIRFE